jgi:hypothetical protein
MGLQPLAQFFREVGNVIRRVAFWATEWRATVAALQRQPFEFINPGFDVHCFVAPLPAQTISAQLLGVALVVFSSMVSTFSSRVSKSELSINLPMAVSIKVNRLAVWESNLPCLASL